jgi:hypothetical protein
LAACTIAAGRGSENLELPAVRINPGDPRGVGGARCFALDQSFRLIDRATTIGNGVFARRFTNVCTPVGDEFQVST